MFMAGVLAGCGSSGGSALGENVAAQSAKLEAADTQVKAMQKTLNNTVIDQLEARINAAIDATNIPASKTQPLKDVLVEISNKHTDQITDIHQTVEDYRGELIYKMNQIEAGFQISINNAVVGVLSNPLIIGMQNQISSNALAISVLRDDVTANTEAIAALEAQVNNSSAGSPGQLAAIEQQLSSTQQVVSQVTENLASLQHAINKLTTLDVKGSSISRDGSLDANQLKMTGLVSANILRGNNVYVTVNLANAVTGFPENHPVTISSPSPKILVNGANSAILTTQEDGINPNVKTVSFLVTVDNSTEAVSGQILITTEIPTATTPDVFRSLIRVEVPQGFSTQVTLTNNKVADLSATLRNLGVNDNGMSGSFVICFGGTVNGTMALGGESAVENWGRLEYFMLQSGYGMTPDVAGAAWWLFRELQDNYPNIESKYVGEQLDRRCVRLNHTYSGTFNESWPAGSSLTFTASGLSDTSITDAYFVTYDRYFQLSDFFTVTNTPQ